MTFGWSPWRYLLAYAVAGFVAAAGVWTLMWALDRHSSPSAGAGVIYVFCYTVLLPLFALLFTRGRPSGLTISNDTIELFAERRDGLIIPYECITSARIRRFWPIAMLDVYVDPADRDSLLELDRDGRRPLIRRKGDRLRCSMPLIGLKTTASTIRTALADHGLAG